MKLIQRKKTVEKEREKLDTGKHLIKVKIRKCYVLYRQYLGHREDRGRGRYESPERGRAPRAARYQLVNDDEEFDAYANEFYTDYRFEIVNPISYRLKDFF